MANTCKVLEKVNAALAIAGRPLLDELPKGTKGSPSDCPLARALRPLGIKSVSGSGASGSLSEGLALKVASAMGGKWLGNGNIGLPADLTQFVRDFDAGEHSAYEHRSYGW